MPQKLRPQDNTLYGTPNPATTQNPLPIVAQRAPGSSDTGYRLGQVWVDRAAQSIYILADVAAGSATWSLAAAVPGEIATLTGDAGGAISPAAGNVNLVGTSGEIETTGAGDTITWSIASPFTPSGNVDIGGTLNVDGACTLATTGASVNTFGNATGATSVAITSGTGGISLASTGSGDITINSTDTLLLDSAGVLEINSSAGVIGIGNDAVAQAINIGTGAAARPITIGNSTGATAVNVDSGSGGILLNDSVNQPTSINTGTSTSTVTIGNSAAGAIAVDTAAGISLDAATASNFTVTGAADLTLQSTAGAVNVLSAEAAADAIVLNASNAAGGVEVQAGTGGIFVGNQADCTTIDVGDIAPTASRTITVGGGTVVTASVTDTIDIGPDGATTNADSIKTVNVNTGGVTTGQVLTNVATGAVTSGTHTTSIASGNVAAGTVAVNILTGTGTKTFNLGNSTGTTMNLDGPFLLNDSINSNTSINTGTSTGTVSIGNSAAGAITVDTAAGISLDGATASNFTVTGAGIDLTLASVGGSVVISSNEAVGTAVGITASDAAGGVTITAGTGKVNVVGTSLALTSAATQLQIEGGAVTDFIGQVTLTNGVGAVANTNIAAADKIFLSRSAINGSTVLGDLTYTISAATSFTVTSVQRADPSMTETNDDSVIEYVIVRQL